MAALSSPACPSATDGEASSTVTRPTITREIVAPVAHGVARSGRVPSLAGRLLAPLALALVLSGCNPTSDAQPAAAPAAPPPPAVGVVKVVTGPVGLTTELPGRLEASRAAQVRARVAGILEKRLFEEGSDVKAGQPLFEIASAPYEATLASARAQLARAQANESLASAQVQRYRPLLQANAVSKQDFDNAVAAQRQAQADVAAARAGIQTAQINLGYASVTAPISGRIGRALVTEGALVGQGEATQLALIQQIDPMYVNFTQSTAELLKLRRDVESGRYKAEAGGASVRIVLDDGTEYDRTGKLLFTDLTVDPTTGQVTLRAEVPNPRGQLLPGMYVRVRLEQAQATDGILLPQQAVTRGSSGDTVMVVAPDGKVAPRKVRIGGSRDNQWVVLDGLKAGELVMVDGFQKLRGGAVKPVPWTPPAAAGAAGSAPAGTGNGASNGASK